MAKNKVVVKEPTQPYYVVAKNVKRLLGPHVVQQMGDQKVVVLTPKQAKFYLTSGVISEYAP